MRITQKEIAAELGVSISLVSRVLSGTAETIGVPQETIDLVQSTARKMGYVPNLAARALKGKSPKTIGVVVYDFNDPFFCDFVGHLQNSLHSEGYSTILVGFSNREISERDLSSLQQHVLDAIIVLGSDTQQGVFDAFEDVPVFRIGHGHKEETTIGFYPNEEDAFQQLADLLKTLNCQRVDYVRAGLSVSSIRADVAQSVFQGEGFDFKLIGFDSMDTFSVGLDYISSIDLKNTPDAVVCGNDQIALGVIKGALTEGLRVPEDIRVTGFDNIGFAKQYSPSLTTFSQPMDVIIERILYRVQSQDFQDGLESFDCPLIRRESC